MISCYVTEHFKLHFNDKKDTEMVTSQINRALAFKHIPTYENQETITRHNNLIHW